MDLGLAGRGIIVTGASRGIGQQIVAVLLAEGARVAGVARDGVRLDEVRDSLPPGQRQRFFPRPADVRDSQEMREAVAAAAGALGRIDGVVAGAGAGMAGTVVGTPDAAWQDQFDIKIRGTLHTVRPAIPALARSGAGSVVVINGVTAHAPDPEMAAVSALRAALASLIRTLAVELSSSGIRVNAVNPGMIMTGRQAARHAAAGTAATFEQWCADEVVRRGILLGRPGRPEEVAPAAAFLLSPLCSYVSGASIDVAGGSGGRG